MSAAALYNLHLTNIIVLCNFALFIFKLSNIFSASCNVILFTFNNIIVSCNIVQITLNNIIVICNIAQFTFNFRNIVNSNAALFIFILLLVMTVRSSHLTPFSDLKILFITTKFNFGSIEKVDEQILRIKWA